VHGAPLWVTVMLCPAMVRVPLRGTVDVLAVTEKFVVPLPEPLLPDVIVIHARLSVAVHAQPAGALIVSVPLLAVDGRFCVAGVTEYVQLMPLWVTVSVRPAMVSVPVRELVPVFAATA
jgi:hypothetical protein